MVLKKTACFWLVSNFSLRGGSLLPCLRLVGYTFLSCASNSSIPCVSAPAHGKDLFRAFEFFSNWQKKDMFLHANFLEHFVFSAHLFSFWPLVLSSAVVFHVFGTTQPKATRTSKIPMEVFFQVGICFQDSPSSGLERQLMEQRVKNFGFKNSGTEDNGNILCAMHAFLIIFFWPRISGIFIDLLLTNENLKLHERSHSILKSDQFQTKDWI